MSFVNHNTKQPAPTLEEIKNHFSKAKEIRCLKLKTTIGVFNFTNWVYNEEENSWNSNNGMVCFWKDGVFATITKKRCSGNDECIECKKKKRNY